MVLKEKCLVVLNRLIVSKFAKNRLLQTQEETRIGIFQIVLQQFFFDNEKG